MELKAYRNLDVAFNTAKQTEIVIAEDYEGYGIEFEEGDEVYLKEDVDAVLAEKDEEIRRLKGDIADLRNDRQSSLKLIDEKNSEVRAMNRELWLERAAHATTPEQEQKYREMVEKFGG